MNKQIKITIITLVLVILIMIAGATVAYFTTEAEDTTAIRGYTATQDLDVEVSLYSTEANGDLIPQLDSTLDLAIIGTDNKACIDGNGNTVCQIYEISLINKGSSLENVKGTIELYAKTGANNVYTNLKWRELTNATTIKEESVINDMKKSVLESGITIKANETKTWYVAVWLSETNTDQTNTDKGEFGGTVSFETIGTQRTEFIEETLAKNAILDTNIDFSSVSSETNGKGIYKRSGTEEDQHPIYYYRGEVDNNLIFANYCWKIVRTTETGGLKLIYNGIPSNGECNNTGEASQISTKAFNENGNSPAYVGYMYGTPYQASSMEVPDSLTLTYGNDVVYENGEYRLINTITDTWANVRNGGLDNYHYTCLSTETTCTNGFVVYVYQTEYNYGYGLELTGGVDIETALEEMLDYNTTGSTIKGDSLTEGTLDYWYATNIAPNYSSYIEDTIWCYDRSLYSLGGFNPNGGPTYSKTQQATMNIFMFNPFMSYMMGETPNLTCQRDIDKFTKSPENGNGDLDYPVGLLTLDEIRLAGGGMAANNTYYLYTGQYYWAGSPILFSDGYAYGSFVDSDGFADGGVVDAGYGLRPSVSLKPGFSIVEGGAGTTTNPYVVR